MLIARVNHTLEKFNILNPTNNQTNDSANQDAGIRGKLSRV
jgi:hypothetical protein